MRPRKSASTCAALVGETWPERLAEGADHRTAECREQSARDWMRRQPHRDAVEAGERQIRDAAVRLLRQHQRQRSGPERIGELFGGGIEAPKPARGIDAADMGDQRIKSRPAFGGIEPGDGFAVAGIGAEPIDGLGRERDQPAAGKAGGCGLDGRRISGFGRQPAFPARRSFFSQACDFKGGVVIRPPSVGV